MDTTRLFNFFNNFTLLNPGLAPFVNDFSWALVKAHKSRLRQQFLQKCLKEQVLPKSILPQRLLKMSNRPFDEFQRIILKKCIDISKLEVKEAFRIKRNKWHIFQQTIPSDYKKTLLDYCYNKMRSVCSSHSQKLNRKLQVLIKNSDWTKHTNPDLVVNLSDKALSEDVITALGYGLSFSNNQLRNNALSIGKAFCSLKPNQDLPIDDINICKGIVYGAWSQEINPTCPERFKIAISNLKKDNDLHITKADKSKVIVILNKVDYLEKMQHLLEDNSTYTLLKNNPTELVNSSYNKKIKLILKDHNDLIKKFTSTSPPLPYMYGLIKTHKPGNPIRPIISSIGSAAYKLSKWLVTILSPLVGTISTAHVNNNSDLINKLNNAQPNYSFKLISYDIVSLFTNIPIDDLLEFLTDELDKHELPLPTYNFIELIKLCVKDCKFQFNDKFYTQTFGMGMGNPLSPVLSNLYMECFERYILSKIIPPGITWLRYVDDILCLWPDSMDASQFLIKLNSLVNSIKFTVEVEKEGALPFLDVKIHRIDREFKFSIYRKPTNVCSYIHYYSSHSDNVKRSVFSSMFLRALRICSPEYLDEEIRCIYDIGDKLKYPQHFIDASYSFARKTFYNPQPNKSFVHNNLLVLPYHENLVNVPKLLKYFNVNVAFSNNNTIKQYLINNSANCHKGCVYKIPCKICNHFYIGQTAKELAVRVKQHKKCVKEGNMSSAIFKHFSTFNHPVGWDQAVEITFNNNIMERNLIECSLIRASQDKNVNLNLGLYKLDNYISNEIAKMYKL